MSTIKLTPVDNNYLTSNLLHKQIVEEFDVLLLDSDNVDGILPPPEILLNGSGGVALLGSVTIAQDSPSTNMQLATLPSYLVPLSDFYFPVTVLRSGASEINHVVIKTGGASINSINVVSPGIYLTMPTVGILGPGTGASLTPVAKALGASVATAGSGYAPSDTITYAGGTETTKAIVTVSGTTLVSAAVNAAGSGYAPTNSIVLSGGTSSTPAQLTVSTTKLVSAAVATAGTGYNVADTITTSLGTASSHAILTLATTKLVSLATNAAGSGYVVNDTITLTGGTHSVAAVVTVTSVSTGAITGFTITTPGSYTVQSTTFTQASTSGSGTGATFQTGLFGVLTFTISTPGSYTANSTTLGQTSTTGSGTGATFNTALYGVNTFAIANGGVFSANTSSFTQASTSGSGTGATFNTALFGVESVVVSTPGSYTVLPSNPISQFATSGGGTSATFTSATWGLLSVTVVSGGSGYTNESTFEVSGGGGNPQATGSLVLADSTVGQVILLAQPTDGDVVYLDNVQFFVQSYD